MSQDPRLRPIGSISDNSVGKGFVKTVEITEHFSVKDEYSGLVKDVKLRVDLTKFKL